MSQFYLHNSKVEQFNDSGDNYKLVTKYGDNEVNERADSSQNERQKARTVPMPRKQAQRELQSASMTREQALTQLKWLRGKAQALLDTRPIASAAKQSWETVASDTLIRAFGENSPNIDSVMSIGRYRYGVDSDEKETELWRAEDMADRIVLIDGLIEMLESEMRIEAGPAAEETRRHGDKVFLVHGHNNEALQETARFIERLGVEAVILREQPNSGRTIIEKFEDHSDVGFAVVLLTADDRGGVARATFEKQQPRARQNVILELGYFLGKLGRLRVCALYQEGVELPSDVSGILYVPLDSGGAWRFALAKEMKAASLPIDMNKTV